LLAPKVRHFTLAKLFLHVGFHKTGTTSLQDALNRNRKELQSQGIIYPKTRKFRAQHEFAWSVGQRGWGWKQFGGSQAGPGPARRMFRLIRSSKQNLIISSEFLSELMPPKIQKLVSSIGDKDLRVIFTVRPVAKILPSAYQQEVKNGSKLTYDKWLDRVLDPEKESRVRTRFWTRHSHHLEIAKWAEVVGSDNIAVIVSDESKPGFLTDSFFRLIGADTSNFRESKKEIVNRSMDLAEIELLRRINEKFDRNLGWDEYVVGIRSTLVKTWTQSLPSEGSPGKLSNPESFKRAIDERVHEVAEGIRGLGVEVIGDIDSLAKATYGTNEIPGAISIEDLVDPILARTRLTTLDSYKSSELIMIAVKRVIKNRLKDLKVLLGKKQKAI
jgi:hypothetical protein